MSLQPESAFLEANGVRLHCLRWGAKGDAPVVLNHPTGFLAALWAPVAERLVSAGYCAYACDARGHGDSDKPPATRENYDWRRFAEDLTGALDALGLRNVPFVGHSMGAGVGLFVAGTCPGYFSRIVAIEPIVMPGGFHPDEERREEMAARARKRRHVFASVDEMVEVYRNRDTFERWPEVMLRLYATAGTARREDGSVELKCSGQIEGQVFANSATLPTWDVLPRIDVPTLIVRGEHTEGFLNMVAEAVAGRVPGARLETVRGAGHLAPFERPDDVAGVILDFLAA